MAAYPFVRLEETRRRLVAQGVEVIDFGKGDPNEPTDPRIRQALVDAVPERAPYPLAAGLPELPLDPERMGQVLGNLLDNALRHTPADGTVTVSASRSPRTGSVQLSVSDTGDGIPAEYLVHVFERFYRVDAARDRAHGGSGIGLAIAKALVEAHDGQLTVTSPGTGQGSTFRILLPRR